MGICKSSTAGKTKKRMEPNSVPLDHWRHILSFASITDLSRARAVSHLWCRLVDTLPSINATLHSWPFMMARVPTSCGGRNLPTAQFQHHVKKMILEYAISLEMLSQIAVELPNLLTWDGKLNALTKSMVDGSVVPIVLPPQLEEFVFSLHGWTIVDVDRMLQAMGKLPHLTTIAMGLAIPSKSDLLVPFLQYPSLRSLSINWPHLNDADTLDSHVAVLRALPLLDYLHLENTCGPELMRQLLATPHTLQFKHLSYLPTRMTDEQTQLLTTLPTLTLLDATDCTLFSSFSFLSALPNLTVVSLDTLASGPVVMEDLCRQLGTCHLIESLSLWEGELTCEQLDSLLPNLPLLHTLLLMRHSMLRSLSCFSHGPITRSLRVLQIVGMDVLEPPMDPIELNHLLACEALDTVQVKNFFEEPVPIPDGLPLFTLYCPTHESTQRCDQCLGRTTE